MVRLICIAPILFKYDRVECMELYIVIPISCHYIANLLDKSLTQITTEKLDCK